MTDNKDISNTETGAASTPNNNINELVSIVNNHRNSTSPTVTSTRTHSPPLMGTSARAAKRRIDSDSGPIRIEGTDIYNQQLQHHYQNVRQILDDQQTQSQTSDVDTPPESRQSFSAKRDFFEQRFKTPPSTYDSPPARQQQTQKIITTTTTTTTTSGTTTSTAHDRTSSSSNESPSVDRVLEQAVELQKLSNINSTKNDSITPLIIERTEEYQVFLNSVNHEVRRTPSISRTTIVAATRTGHATDLDQAQAQAQVENLTDDHQAIQQLTRVLQEHNVTTINEYKRLPSQTSPSTPSQTNPSTPSQTKPASPSQAKPSSPSQTKSSSPFQTKSSSSSQINPSSPSVLPSTVLIDRTNLPPITSEFSVIDALLNNPLGTTDNKYNSLLNVRYNDIITNLRNPEYLNTLKQPTKPSKESKKKPKETKPKETKPKETKPKKKASVTTDTVEQTIVSSPVNTSISLPVQTIETITTTTISTEQTPLIDPKEKKKQDKENKKENKTKSKQKSKNGDYDVLDAIIGSPISIRLPDSYLAKYHVSAPLSQSSLSQPVSPSIPSNIVETTTTTTKPTPKVKPPPTPKVKPTPTPKIKPTPKSTSRTTSKDDNIPITDKDQTLHHLTKIVHEIQAHNAAALAASLNTTTPTIKTTTTIKESKEPVITTKASIPIKNETVHQQPLLEQQKHPVIYSTPTEVRPHSDVLKPRVIYRYIDEQGRVLKLSSTPPSQLREQPPQQQYTYRNTEPPYFHGRYIAVDDERRHLLPQYEQRATWQGEPKLPTTLTREDFELRDKRVPRLSEQSVPTTRTVPVSVEHERLSKPPSSQQQPRTYHYPNQQNVKLAWLPLSYQQEQPYVPSGTVGYDTDSTISERSATYRPYEYGPPDSHYHYPHRPLYNDYYYNSQPGPSYYPPPPPLPYGGRGISPEYGGIPRNHIEVFRGGDFRETKPSEIYSLPLSEHIRTSPISPSSNRHSRYDQYQSERYGTVTGRNSIPSLQNNYNTTTLPNSRYQQNIPPTTVHTSSYYTHRSPYHHRTVQSSPNPDYSNYVRQSKSFDYRPLRTKLQREYKITPNLLVDEWDYPQTSEKIKSSTTTSNANRSGLSSPDDVFINNRTNQA